MNANPLSTVGLMLTLAGLVGSFFNIQLSQWLRDLLALKQKATLNKAQGNETQQKAIVESKIELEKLANRQTYIVNGLVLSFVVCAIPLECGSSENQMVEHHATWRHASRWGSIHSGRTGTWMPPCTKS